MANIPANVSGTEEEGGKALMEQPQTSVRLRNNAEAILARNSNRKSRILAEAATFTELVQNSTVFIDKTNFVFDVMKDDQSQGFWFSRRMCKSHLLTMLHTIISQEKRDEWEDLKTLPQCAKLEILKNEDFLALHENKHPALYLNLLITGQLKSFRDFEAKVSELMSEIYKQHNWLLTSLEQKIKKKKSIWKSMSWGRSDQYASSITRFKKIMNGKAERIDLSQSLKLLVEFARVYYDVGEKGKKKTVVLIMDEFDSIPRLARVWLEKEEAASAISFFGEMVSVFEEPRVRGVICGHYKSVHDFYSLRHMHHHTALANTKLTKYFGFSSEEFNVLCDHFEVPTEHREKLTSWYNGYRMNLLSKKNQTKVYNPSCVAQYLLKFENDPNMSFESFKAVEMNIKPLEDILHLQELFMHKWIKPKLLELATNGFTLAARRDYLQFNSTIMGQLYDAAKNMRLGEVDPFLIDVVLAFLLHAGYILIKDRSGEKLELEITNKFHKNELCTMLKNYFTKLFSKLMDKIHPAAIAFHDAYHSALDDDDDELSSKLEEFRQHLVSVVNHNDFCRLGNNDPLPSTSLFFFPNECIFHELFDFCVMLIESLSFFGTEVPSELKYTPTMSTTVRSDTSMADFKNGIANIVEHKYGANGNEHTALEQSTLYKQYFEGQISSDRIKRILFLGIHFKSVGTVHEGPMEVHLTHFLLKVNDPTSEAKFTELHTKALTKFKKDRKL